ncbi:hypothetical protein Efla_000897 [Eimeria flavescens]
MAFGEPSACKALQAARPTTGRSDSTYPVFSEAQTSGGLEGHGGSGGVEQPRRKGEEHAGGHGVVDPFSAAQLLSAGAYKAQLHAQVHLHKPKGTAEDRREADGEPLEAAAKGSAPALQTLTRRARRQLKRLGQTAAGGQAFLQLAARESQAAAADADAADSELLLPTRFASKDVEPHWPLYGDLFPTDLDEEEEEEDQGTQGEQVLLQQEDAPPVKQRAAAASLVQASSTAEEEAAGSQSANETKEEEKGAGEKASASSSAEGTGSKQEEGSAHEEREAKDTSGSEAGTHKQHKEHAAQAAAGSNDVELSNKTSEKQSQAASEEEDDKQTAASGKEAEAGEGTEKEAAESASASKVSRSEAEEAEASKKEEKSHKETPPFHEAHAAAKRKEATESAAASAPQEEEEEGQSAKESKEGASTAAETVGEKETKTAAGKASAASKAEGSQAAAASAAESAAKKTAAEATEKKAAETAHTEEEKTEAHRKHMKELAERATKLANIQRMEQEALLKMHMLGEGGPRVNVPPPSETSSMSVQDMEQHKQLEEATKTAESLTAHLRVQHELKQKEMALKQKEIAHLNLLKHIQVVMQSAVSSVWAKLSGAQATLKRLVQQSTYVNKRFLRETDNRVLRPQELPKAVMSEEERKRESILAKKQGATPLDCPVECAPKSCDNKPSFPTHCFRYDPVAGGGGFRTCAPFADEATAACPESYTRCAMAAPVRGRQYELLSSAASDPLPQALFIRGNNMHSCLRLMIVHKETQCTPSDTQSVQAALKDSQAAGGSSMPPPRVLEHGVASPGEYKLCMLQFWVPPEKLKGDVIVLGVDEIGSVTVVDAKTVRRAPPDTSEAEKAAEAAELETVKLEEGPQQLPLFKAAELKDKESPAEAREADRLETNNEIPSTIKPIINNQPAA